MRLLISVLVACQCSFLTNTASALDCPPFPQQASKDWEVEVNAAVVKIGPVKGGELSTRTRSATKDLMGKLPDGARVYLEQMMYAGYCTALRDDKTISEGEKARQLQNYRREVLRAISGARGQDKDTARKVAELTSEIRESRKEQKEWRQSWDQRIIAFRNSAIIETRPNDPRMADGGRVAVDVVLKDGTIIDIGNKNTPRKNRISVTSKYPDQIFLHLYDSDAKYWGLQAKLSQTDKPIQLDCIWSSKDHFIAIFVDGKILSKIDMPELKLFHDKSEEREILIGHNFEGVTGFNTIRNVQVFASKELPPA